MLKIKDLCSGYGKVQILNKAGLEVHPGEIVSLIGRNGMGKSTFIKTVIGILPVTSGEISFPHDKDISKVSAYKPIGPRFCSAAAVSIRCLRHALPVGSTQNSPGQPS